MVARFRLLSLFSGCGGLDLGLRLSGMELVWAVDVDPHAVETYRRHVWDGIVQADVRELDPGSLPEADMVAGGPPCQPYSVSGKRRGSRDERHCLPEFLRIASALRPPWVLLENVGGLVVLEGGRYLAELCEGLAEAGYRTWQALVDAAAYGVPQHRRRLILVGNRSGREFLWPEPTHGPPREHLQQRFWGPERQPYVTVWEALGLPYDRPAICVTASECKGAGGKRRRASDMLYLVGEPAEALAETVLARPSPTVCAGNSKGWFASEGGKRAQARRLTVRECARLQSFPDWFTFSGPGGSQYRQVDEAVPPLLAWHLGNAILAAEGLATSPVPTFREFVLGGRA